jgi:hypothetical protein
MLGSFTIGSSDISGSFSGSSFVNILIVLSLSSLAWSGHLFHVSIARGIILDNHLLDTALYVSSSLSPVAKYPSFISQSHFDVIVHGGINPYLVLAHHAALSLTGGFVVIFHYYWKRYSDCLGVLIGVLSDKGIASFLEHIGGASDFAINAININGWLRSFLWSKSGCVVQGYGTSITGYNCLFLLSHFVWAFSLMFLFSGRGYWQELIEGIVWAHHKLGVVQFIGARALSITQGRAVGVTHYIIGGIGVSWSFFIGSTS